MDIANILSFTLVAGLLVISPGPNGVLIAKTVPSSGRVVAFANIAGFFTAFYVHGLFSILGISLILVQSAEAFFIVKILGALYLCWIGYQALCDAWRGNTPEKEVLSLNPKKMGLVRAFIEGFLTNALNPKVSMFYLAAFPQFISTTETAVQSALLLVFIHSVLNVIWFTGMVIVFSQLTNAVQSKSFQRWLKGVTGFIFIGFGVKLATLRAP